MAVGGEGGIAGAEGRPLAEGVVVVSLLDSTRSVDDSSYASQMVFDRVVRRHSRSVLQKSCSTVDACFRTFKGVGRVPSADGHGIGQVAGVDHAAAACVFHAVFRSVGEPVVGGRLGVAAGHRFG